MSVWLQIYGGCDVVTWRTISLQSPHTRSSVPRSESLLLPESRDAALPAWLGLINKIIQIFSTSSSVRDHLLPS